MTEQPNNQPASSNPVLRTQDLQKSFGDGDARVIALKKVNLQVPRGEFLAVMGPSGSGKTTLLTLLGGIDTPTSGKVLLEGEDISAMTDTQLAQIRRRKIGFVFQNFNLLPILRAEANIALPLLLDQQPKKKALERAHQLMERLGIAHRRHHLPSAMSGGEQQRVAICRALAPKPPIILADEPTGNLDTKNGQALIQLLRKLVDDDGQTLVMVTHDVKSAVASDRVVLFKDGQIHTEIVRKDITIDNLTRHLNLSES